MFLWTRKLKKKKGIEEKENHITTFDALNLGLFVNVKKLF